MAMTYESVLQRLADVEYKDAISYYNQMRMRFFTEFEQALPAEYKKHSFEYINQFLDFASTNVKQQWSDADKFVIQLKDAIENKISGDIDKFPAVKAELGEKYANLSEKAKAELTAYINSVIDIKQIVTEILDGLGLSDNTGNNTVNDMISWSLGYFRSLMYQRFSNPQANNAGNKAALAGYFEEALFNQAAQQLVAHIGGHTRSINTGSIKGNKGLDTALDQYFNFLSEMDNIGGVFKASLDSNNATLKEGFGAQAKLWKVPWETMEKNRRKYYSIGSRSELLEQADVNGVFDKQLGWIKGVRFLENHVREALGDNVMYITNNVVVWTCDLIKNFRAMQYFLAFHFDKVGKPGKGVGWEQIDISKAE